MAFAAETICVQGSNERKGSVRRHQHAHLSECGVCASGTGEEYGI